MLPFVFSLALPLLAGVNPPTWSLREVERTPTFALSSPPRRSTSVHGPWMHLTLLCTKLQTPLWWMRCDWLDAPRSPEPAVSVTPCDLDDRYKTARLANQP